MSMPVRPSLEDVPWISAATPAERVVQVLKRRMRELKLAKTRTLAGPVPAFEERKSMENENEVARPRFTQWTVHGKGYTPAFETAEKLPAGVYTMDYAPDGFPIFVPKNLATDNLLRLPDSSSDQVIAEVEAFWAQEAKYRRLGYVYKRGFILYGPPGSGKTSTLEFVSSQLVQDDGVVFIPRVSYSSAAVMLHDFRAVEPDRRCVVIAEDLDSVIDMQGEQEVLSLLDGESSVENVLFIATTNYIDKLPPRLINRPSRFDRRMYIGMPTKEARFHYLRSRPVEIDGVAVGDEVLQRWAALTDGLSIAHLKEVIICVCIAGLTVEEAVERMHSMGIIPKSDSTDGPRTVGFD